MKKAQEEYLVKNHLLFRTSLASIQSVLPKRLLAIKQFFLFYFTVNLPKRCIVLQSSSLYFVCVIVLFQDVILKLWKLSLLTGNYSALRKNGIHCRLLFIIISLVLNLYIIKFKDVIQCIIEFSSLSLKNRQNKEDFLKKSTNMIKL